MEVNLIMVCYFVECENIDELKSMLNFCTAGLPYVAEWVTQNLEKQNSFPVYANISFFVDYGIVLNDIDTNRPLHRFARIFTYDDFVIMIKAISHQIMDN